MNQSTMKRLQLFTDKRHKVISVIPSPSLNGEQGNSGITLLVPCSKDYLNFNQKLS